MLLVSVWWVCLLRWLIFWLLKWMLFVVIGVRFRIVLFRVDLLDLDFLIRLRYLLGVMLREMLCSVWNVCCLWLYLIMRLLICSRGFIGVVFMWGFLFCVG